MGVGHTHRSVALSLVKGTIKGQRHAAESGPLSQVMCKLSGLGTITGQGTLMTQGPLTTQGHTHGPGALSQVRGTLGSVEHSRVRGTIAGQVNFHGSTSGLELTHRSVALSRVRGTHMGQGYSYGLGAHS